MREIAIIINAIALGITMTTTILNFSPLNLLSALWCLAMLAIILIFVKK